MLVVIWVVFRDTDYELTMSKLSSKFWKCWICLTYSITYPVYLPTGFTKIWIMLLAHQKEGKKEENFEQKLPSSSIKLCSKSILKRVSQHETNHLACYAEDLTAFTVSGKFMSPTIQQNKMNWLFWARMNFWIETFRQPFYFSIKA